MRYQVGHKYVFMALTIREVNKGLAELYKPWEDKALALDIFDVECISIGPLPLGRGESETRFKVVATNTVVPVGTELTDNASDWLEPTFEGMQVGEPDYELLIHYWLHVRVVNVVDTLNLVRRGYTSPDFQSDNMAIKKAALVEYYCYLTEFVQKTFGSVAVAHEVLRLDEATRVYTVPTGIYRIRLHRDSTCPPELDFLKKPEELAADINQRVVIKPAPKKVLVITTQDQSDCWNPHSTIGVTSDILHNPLWPITKMKEVKAKFEKDFPDFEGNINWNWVILDLE